jgi:ribosome biogenesis GTPase
MGTELAALGLVPFFQQQLTDDELQRCHLVRVTEVQRSVLTTSDGVRDRTVPLTGHWLDAPPEAKPTIGDWVLLDGQSLRLVRVLERKSLFRRVAAGEKSSVQLIAANIDVLFVVTSCNDEFKESRLERYLALAAEAEVIPVIVLTKSDLVDDPSSWIDRARSVRRGIAVETVNALAADTLDGIRGWLAEGTTAALVGSSGVGKSTLINTLLGTGVAATAAIRDDDAKGRHTTSHRSLHLLPEGGLLADVPGMRELKVAELGAALATVFDDIEAFARDCRFADCSHQTEPGCAVREAVESGAIDRRRWQNFVKLVREDARNSESLAEKHAREREFGRVVRNMKNLHKDLGLKR